MSERDRLPVARVFFALWPAAPVRDELAAWSRKVQGACGGRPTAAEKIHLTLVFVGNVEVKRLDELGAAAAEIKGERFELTLDRLGYWPHNRIVWAGAARLPAALVQFVSALEERLERWGYAFDRRPYAAHATLVRNARPGELFVPHPLNWRAEDFVLVQSVLEQRGSRYSVIGRWPLFAPAS